MSTIAVAALRESSRRLQRTLPGRARVLLLLLALAGCARSIPPPGGPRDTTPPQVVATSPADSAVNVSSGTAIEVLFSEPMERGSVRDNLRLYPPPGRLSYHWSGHRFRIEWGDSLAPGTTYQLFLSGRARDLRGVPLGKRLQLRFSTGATLAPGQINGKLRAKTLLVAGVPILLFPDSLGLRPDTTGSFEPTYQTETDTAGVYQFTGLSVDRGYTVHAFFDRNGDSYLDTELEVVAGHGAVVRLTPERTVADSINIVAVDPKAPAILNGAIASPDSTARFLAEARASADSSLVARTERIGPGTFALRVPAGSYRLSARRLGAAARAARGVIPAARAISEAATSLEETIIVGPEDNRGPFVLTFPPAPAEQPVVPAPQEEPR
ncbi:MAG: Ig-like domain-containing protein [Candidatus Eisenbacteria bacterium]